MAKFESAGEAEAAIDNGTASDHYERVIRPSAGATSSATATAAFPAKAASTGLEGYGGNAAGAAAAAAAAVKPMPLAPGSAATVKPTAHAAADRAPGGAQATTVLATGRPSLAKEVAAGGFSITNEFPGSVVWASRDGVLWPAIGQRLLGSHRCAVHFLGPITAKSEEEVDMSSLKTFPGGVRVALLRKRPEPKRELGDKTARDDSLRSDLVHAANEREQRRQLAIDHAVHLCVKYLWRHDKGVANVITGKNLDGLDKKQRIRERQARIRILLGYPEQWTSRNDTRRSYQRFRAVFNDRSEGAHPLCGQLRFAEISVRSWIARRGSSMSSTAVTRPNLPALQGDGSACDRSAASEEVNTQCESLPKARRHGQPEPPTGDGGAGGGGDKDNDDESSRWGCSTAEAPVASRRTTSTKGTRKLDGRSEIAPAWGGGGSAAEATVVGKLEADTSRANGGVKPFYRPDFNVSRLNSLYQMAGITLDAVFYSKLLGEAARAAKGQSLAANNALAAGDEAGRRRVDDSGRGRSGNGGHIDPAPRSQNKRNAPGGGGNYSVGAGGTGQTSKEATAPKKRRKSRYPHVPRCR